MKAFVSAETDSTLPVDIRRRRELRHEFASLRESLSRAEVESKSRAIFERFLSLPEYIDSDTVMVYISFRNEVETEPIIRDALKRGKRVVAPRTLREERQLIPHVIEGYEDLEPGAYGILEPKRTCPTVIPKEIDLVIVPGMVFDLRGYRIGYGGGYYDHFLKLVWGTTVKVGIAYDFQIVEKIPDELLDVPVDIVISEERTIRAQDSAHQEPTPKDATSDRS